MPGALLGIAVTIVNKTHCPQVSISPVAPSPHSFTRKVKWYNTSECALIILEPNCGKTKICKNVLFFLKQLSCCDYNHSNDSSFWIEDSTSKWCPTALAGLDLLPAWLPSQAWPPPSLIGKQRAWLSTRLMISSPLPHVSNSWLPCSCGWLLWRPQC